MQTTQPRGPRVLPGSRRNGAAGAGPHQGCPWGRDQWRSCRGRACVRAGHPWTPSWASPLGSCSHYQRGKGSSPGLPGGGVFPEPRTESGSVAWVGEGSAEGAGTSQRQAFSLGWEVRPGGGWLSSQPRCGLPGGVNKPLTWRSRPRGCGCWLALGDPQSWLHQGLTFERHRWPSLLEREWPPPRVPAS